MPAIHLETFIHAPIDRCFDLMRDVEAHTRSTLKTRERAVAGKTRGLRHHAGDQRVSLGSRLITGLLTGWRAVVPRRLTDIARSCQ